MKNDTGVKDIKPVNKLIIDWVYKNAGTYKTENGDMLIGYKIDSFCDMCILIFKVEIELPMNNNYSWHARSLKKDDIIICDNLIDDTTICKYEHPISIKEIYKLIYNYIKE